MAPKLGGGRRERRLLDRFAHWLNARGGFESWRYELALMLALTSVLTAMVVSDWTKTTHTLVLNKRAHAAPAMPSRVQLSTSLRAPSVMCSATTTHSVTDTHAKRC